MSGFTRPDDSDYWTQPWSRVLFSGDLFAAVPFVDQPSEEFVDDQTGKHLLSPIAYGYGLLISPTCDMVDQKTHEQSHPYRLVVPVVPIDTIARDAPGQAGNLGLIRSRDQIHPYMYLPALPDLFPESAALLYRASLIDDASLRDIPRRVAQLAPEGRRHLKIKLIRYFGRMDPDRDLVTPTEKDEESFALADGEASPYDLDPAAHPEDAPIWSR